MAKNSTQYAPLLLAVAPWQLALLVGIVAICLIFNLLVTVAIFRVSRNLHPFLLFLSEGIANCYSLATFLLCYAGQLLHLRLLGDQATEVLIVSLMTYTSQLHYLLIAVNRGCAIFLPLSYDMWWPRANIIASLVLLWVLGSMLELINIFHYVTLQRLPLFRPIYAAVQRCTTFSSLAIYSAALCWVLVSRLRLWIKQHSSVADARSAAQMQMNSNMAVVSAKAIDLRIFAYCFLSFLPNCYYIVVSPAAGSMHMQLSLVFRIASSGLFLYIMSAPTKEQMPLGLGKAGRYFACRAQMQTGTPMPPPTAGNQFVPNSILRQTIRPGTWQRNNSK